MSSTQYAKYSGFSSASVSGVTSINSLTGAITLAAGTGISITPSGNTLTFASTQTYGNLTDVGTDGITITGGTGAVVGAGTSISQHVADSTHNGYLSSTDWNTFNNKQSALTFGDLTDVGTDGIVITGGVGSVIGSGTSIAQHVADTTHNGYLSSTDWNTFNNKQAALTFGNLTDVGTDGITITGGTGAVIGSGTSLSQHVADTTHNGYLSSTDWNTFNGKQPAGNYITALTGDVTASGPGSAAATLASVGTAGTYVKVTTDAKGRVTSGSASPQAIADGGTGQTSASAAFGALSPLTTKGDILGFSTLNDRVPIGSNGQVLTADSTQAFGFKWATPSSVALSEVVVNTGNGSGSTNTVIRRFSTTESNTGSDITYADSATDGASFTVNANGIYGMSYTDENGGTATLGISRNSNQLTTSIASITSSNEVVLANMVSGNPTNVGAQMFLSSGDVIRPHNGTSLSSTSTYVKFRIIRIT